MEFGHNFKRMSKMKSRNNTVRRGFMKKENYKRYTKIVVVGFCVIALGILFFFTIFRIKDIHKAWTDFIYILRPFVYGGVLAFLLIPVCNMLDKKLHRILSKVVKTEKHRDKICEGVSIFLSVIFAFTVVITLLYLVIPQVYTSLIRIIQELPDKITQSVNWLEKIIAKNPVIDEYLNKISGTIDTNFKTWVNSTIIPSIQSVLNGFSIGVFSVVNFIKDIFIGVIVAIYILSNREKFSSQAKKIIYSTFSVKKANAILDETRFANKVFGGFVNGKILDSLIIAVLCFIFMYTAKMPYPMLISVIIGVTNIIPFFGPFIGAIPSGLLILLISPIKCLYFGIFILILQQFDGNILGPKILGDSIGLDSFWVLFSIIFFGGIFGFVGMVLGVPIFAVIQDIVKRIINNSLNKKKLSTIRNNYDGLQKIDEENKYHYYD